MCLTSVGVSVTLICSRRTYARTSPETINVRGFRHTPEAHMIQIMGQYGDIIFAATCSDTWTPDLADDMVNQVRRALITANAQLLDAKTIDG